MKENIQHLRTSDISSQVFTIAPSQIEYIAQIFGDRVADAMNMRAFSQRIRQIAASALVEALGAARHQGEK